MGSRVDARSRVTDGNGFELEALTGTPGCVTVVVRGELDMATAPLLDGFVVEHVRDATSSTVLVIDLAGVTFLGSSGLSVLLGWHHGHEAHPEVTLHLSGAAESRVVSRAMSVTGLGTVFRHRPDRV